MALIFSGGQRSHFILDISSNRYLGRYRATYDPEYLCIHLKLKINSIDLASRASVGSF